MILWLLAACLVTDEELFEALDRDRDGVLPEVAGGRDCDNADGAVNPDAVEICGDGIDNDCDGVVDDDGEGAVLWYFDGDRDGYGADGAWTVSACSQPVGYAAVIGDCADDDPGRRPGVVDGCDEVDNDCDGEVDEDAEFEVYYPDEDGDGAGAWDGGQSLCARPPGWWTTGTDCDDSDPAVQRKAWYADVDEDGWGDPAFPSNECERPAGYVAVAEDCDDRNNRVNPGMVEICENGVDDDCDGFSLGCGLLRDAGPDASIADGVDPAFNGRLIDINLDGAVDLVLQQEDGLAVHMGGLLQNRTFPVTVGGVEHVSAGRYADSGESLILAGGAGGPFWSEGQIAGIAVPSDDGLALSSPAAWGLFDDAVVVGALFGGVHLLGGRPMVATSATGLSAFPATPERRFVTLADATWSVVGHSDTIGLEAEVIDSDSDGVDDILVSSPATDGVQLPEGPGALFFFSDLESLSGVLGSGDADAAIVEAEPIGFGIRIVIGDVDEDGHEDIVATTSGLFEGAIGGVVDVFRGPVRRDGVREDAFASVGDGVSLTPGPGQAQVVDVDGEALVAIGAPLRGGVAPTGAVHLFAVNAGEWTDEDALGLLAPSTFDSVGVVTLVQDLDKDGQADILTAGGQFGATAAIHIFLGSSL